MALDRKFEVLRLDDIGAPYTRFSSAVRLMQSLVQGTWNKYDLYHDRFLLWADVDDREIVLGLRDNKQGESDVELLRVSGDDLLLTQPVASEMLVLFVQNAIALICALTDARLGMPASGIYALGLSSSPGNSPGGLEELVVSYMRRMVVLLEESTRPPPPPKLNAAANSRLNAAAEARKARIAAEAKTAAEARIAAEAMKAAAAAAEEQRRRDAEEQRRRDAEEQRRRDAEEQRRRDAEEQRRRDAEEQRRRDAKERKPNARISNVAAKAPNAAHDTKQAPLTLSNVKLGDHNKPFANFPSLNYLFAPDSLTTDLNEIREKFMGVDDETDTWYNISLKAVNDHSHPVVGSKTTTPDPHAPHALWSKLNEIEMKLMAAPTKVGGAKNHKRKQGGGAQNGANAANGANGKIPANGTSVSTANYSANDVVAKYEGIVNRIISNQYILKLVSLNAKDYCDIFLEALTTLSLRNNTDKTISAHFVGLALTTFLYVNIGELVDEINNIAETAKTKKTYLARHAFTPYTEFVENIKTNTKTNEINRDTAVMSNIMQHFEFAVGCVKDKKNTFVYITRFLAQIPENKAFLNTVYLPYITNNLPLVNLVADIIISLIELNTKTNIKNGVTTLQSSIDAALQKDVNNRLLTYVRIRCEKTTLNQRYLLKTNARSLVVKHYQTDKWLGAIKNAEELDGHVKSHTYVLGPFARVFGPQVTNVQIAKDVTEITNALNRMNPVFVFGYGASGAGKTSSLIYLNDGNGNVETGILMHICDAMGQTYRFATVTCFEFYHDNNDQKRNKPIVFQFRDDSNEYTTHAAFDMNFVHDRVRNGIFKDKFKNIATEEELSTSSFNVEIDTPMKHVLKFLIDDDRLVKATTNNINSSRSHALVFITFKKSAAAAEGADDDNNNPLLIVGDFAGVENSFECEKKEISDKFGLIVGVDGKTFYDHHDAFRPKDPRRETNDMSCTSDVYNFDEKLPDEKQVMRTPDWKKLDKEIQVKFNMRMKDLKKNKQRYVKLQKLILDKKVVVNGEVVAIRDLPHNLVAARHVLKTHSNPITIDKVKLRSLIERLLQYEIESLIKLGVTQINLIKFNDIIQVPKEVDANFLNKYPGFKVVIPVPNMDTTKNMMNNRSGKQTTTDTTLNEYVQFQMRLRMAKQYNVFVDYVKNMSDDDDEFYTFQSSINNKIIDDNMLMEGFPALTFDVKTILLTENRFLDAFLSKTDVFSSIREQIFPGFNSLNIMKIVAGSRNLKELLEAIKGDVDGWIEVTSLVLQFVYDESMFVIKDMLCKLNKRRVICDNRLEEGHYINNTLSTMRDVISRLMYEKNKDRINGTPEFIAQCLSQYGNHGKYFDKKDMEIGDLRKDIEVNIMIKTIFDELSSNYTNPLECLTQMVICMFTVFNANNEEESPPVPYIDLSVAKSKLANISKEPTNAEIVQLSVAMAEVVRNIEDNYGKKFEHIRDSEMYSSFDHFHKDVVHHSDNLNFRNSYRSTCSALVDEMHTSNMSSPMGTLEYTDQFAKFNLTSGACTIGLMPEDAQTDLEKLHNMQEIVIEDDIKRIQRTIAQKKLFNSRAKAAAKP